MLTDRLRELEAESRKRSEAKAINDMEAVRERQLRAARYVQTRALEAMKALPAERAAKLASALSIGWKHELLLLGEPTERAASVEDVTRREVRDLLVGRDEEDDWGDGDGDPDHDDQPAPSQ